MANYDFVDAPVRKPRRGGLLAVADVIDGSARTGMGVQWIEEGCDLPVVAPGLCWQVLEAPQVEVEAGVFEDAPKVGVGLESGAADPFALYSGVECFMGAGDTDFEDRARRKLEAGEGAALEALVYQLLLEPLSADAASPVSLIEAAALAEQRAGQYPGLPVFHMNRHTAALLAESGYASADDDWVLHTEQGTPIANGSGYPMSTPGELFVTGQVTIWRSPITTTMTRDHISNRTLAIAERTYAVSFDCFGTKFEIS